MTRVAIHEARERLPELMTAAAHGEEVLIVAPDGSACRIVPTPQETGRGFGALRGRIHMTDDFDEPLDELFGFPENKPASQALI